MVIRGTPNNISDYYIADSETAFRLQQAGAKPLYVDYDATYFKKTNKLIKILKRLGITEF